MENKRESTWFAKILEGSLAELEEFGDFHDEACNCLREEECDCDMRGLKPFLEVQMTKLNQYWIRNIDEHRPYCSPQGNKVLTRVKGAKNRKPTN